MNMCSYVVKTRNTSEALNSVSNAPLGPDTDCGPVGLGWYVSLGEYCGPHTASSLFLMLVSKVTLIVYLAH